MTVSLVSSLSSLGGTPAFGGAAGNVGNSAALVASISRAADHIEKISRLLTRHHVVESASDTMLSVRVMAYAGTVLLLTMAICRIVETVDQQHIQHQQQQQEQEEQAKKEENAPHTA